ncbi:hypothetical protein ACUY2X_04635 [Corynebacterium minutissimum]
MWSREKRLAAKGRWWAGSVGGGEEAIYFVSFFMAEVQFDES